jgi:aflatoxin B1 aldehyde reductase
MGAINEMHAAGKFKRFGLSNFEAKDVEFIYDYQSANQGVLPTVFQGNYNAVSRPIESTLFPTLRKLGISFHAYSPIAGGFLVRSADQFQEGKAGAPWDQSSM